MSFMGNIQNKINLNQDVNIEPTNIENISDKVKNINNNMTTVISNKKVKEIENVNEKIEEINKNVKSNIPIVKNINVDKNKLFETKGILDPEGKELNPLTGEPYQNLYKNAENLPGSYINYSSKWSKYPTYEKREEIIKMMYDNQCLLLTAGTGAGKTVLAPKFLLHVLNYQGKIAITIPKRVPTIGAAEYAAKTLDVPLGQQVGYMVKDEKKSSSNTKLVYATDGYILAKINGGDPTLEEFDALIIDEAHERNERIDQLLLYVKRILKIRPKFKFIIMSATIDPKIFLNYYKEFGMKHIKLVGTPLNHIDEIFLKTPVNKVAPNGEIISRKEDYINKVAEIIVKDILFSGKPGDILALFPGKADCDDACKTVEKMIKDGIKNKETFTNKPFCISLHSSSKKIPFGNIVNQKTGKLYTRENYATGAKSYKNLNEDHTRRIIMATEVAESAITFQGDAIDFVIDTGLVNSQKYYPDSEIEALEKRYIAKANHIQRRGRTGRKQPGTCYNIFTEEEYKKYFLEYSIPPILESDVTPLVLTFLNLKNVTHINLPFSYPTKKDNNNKTDKEETLNIIMNKLIEPPSILYVENAIKKLFLIGALEVNGKKAVLTNLGKALRFFRDIPPEKAAAIIESHNYKCSNEMIHIMALLETAENKISNILSGFNPKTKDTKSQEYKNEKKEYENKLKQISSSYGDHITIYKIMKTYIEKNYTISYEKGRRNLISNESGEGATWAREHYINANILKKSMKMAKDIDNSLGRSIGFYRKENPNDENKKFIYREVAPIIPEKIEDRIMISLLKGFIGHIVKKTGKKYKTCFPLKKEVAEIDKFSLFHYLSVKPSTCVYGNFISISGMGKFQTFTKVPLSVIDSLNKEDKKIIDDCSKATKSNSNSKNIKKSQKGHKSSKVRDRSKSRKKGLKKR